MVQRQGPAGGGQSEKGLFESLFPTIYSLYKMVKKNRPSPRKSAKGGQASSQPSRGRPSQGADGQQASRPTGSRPPGSRTISPGT